MGSGARRLSALALLVLLVPSTGCLGPLVNPIGPNAREREHCAHALPQCSRNHVYVFAIHGTDPFDLANLSGVCDHLRAEGYIKTWYGQCYHAYWFAHEIRRLHQEDPDAHYVLIGFSFGANMARDVANSVAKDGIDIDLLVYMGGNTLKNVPKDRPCNAHRVINILACGCIWNGAVMDNALNIQYDDVYHFGSPAHHVTLQTLDEELERIAARVPVVSPAPIPVNDGPRGRPAMPGVEERDTVDGWDFIWAADAPPTASPHQP
jgi:hypothetical protein